MSAHTRMLLSHLHRLAAPAAADSVLLALWTQQRDQAAFAALMARHGPMVLSVCRRLLKDEQEAEDVFQAVFVVLSRQAAQLRQPEALAGFLHTVSVRLAHKAHKARRQQRLQTGAQTPEPIDPRPHPLDVLSGRELLAVLDEEIARLREAYRLPVLLCLLQGRSIEEAARQLGWSIGSVRGRLARGREQLRKRLTRRGLDLSVGAVALLVPGAVPEKLLAESLRQLIGAVPATISVLADGMMPAVKLKILGLVLILATAAALGVGLSFRGTPLPEPPAAPSSASPLSEQTKDALRLDRHGDPLPPGALVRLGTVRFRQGSWIYSLDLSPDGRKLITVGGNSRLHLWDMATGKELYHFPVEKRPMTTNAAAFSPDGRTFATGGNFGFSLWQTDIRKRLYSMEWFPVYSLAFAPDGKTLATGSLEKGPALWDAASGEKIAQLEEQAAGAGRSRVGFHSLAFAPNGRLFASTYGSSVILWNVATRKEIRRLEGHDKPLHTTAFSPNGKFLASGGEDKTIRLWDASTGRELRRLKGHQATITSLVFSADGKRLISGSGGSPVFDPGTKERKALRFWDVASGEERGAIDEQRSDMSSCFLSLSPDGKLLVAADGGCVRLWDPATRQEVRPLSGHRHWIGGIAFAPDGKHLATAGGDCTVRLWDAATGRQLRTFACSDEPVDSVVFSPDGRTIASASRDGILRLWDASSGREIHCIRAHEARQTYIAFSPDGTRLASASRDATAALWDVATGKEVRRFKGDFDGFLCVAFSPDCKRIAAGEIYGKQHTELRKGPDAARPLVRVWDVGTGKQIHALKGHTNLMIGSVAFSPDGRMLASTGWDKTTRLWDMATGQMLGQISSGDRSVEFVTFSPDGRMLATGGFDGTVRLWEAATLKERRHFAGHQAYIQGLAFSPDGRTLASTSMDSTALLWDIRGFGSSLQPIDGKECWRALAEDDAAKAYRTIADLSADPEQAVPLLRQHLRPVHSPDLRRLARLVADLDSERFEVREEAGKEIEGIGELAKPVLKKALGGKPSLEVRRRIELLLSNIEPAHSPEQLRALRAVEVLEYLGTPAARRVLETLASGSAEALLTREAKASLRRLDLHKTKER